MASANLTIDLSQLARQLEKDAKKLIKSLAKSIQETAVRAVKPIQQRAPKAFGELRDSVYPTDLGSEPKTSVMAPHAGAVEIGSTPHTPNWERLLEWVKLRGMQGLTKKGRLRKSFKRSEGPTTPQQAKSIASRIKSLEVGRGKGHGRFSPIDSAEQVARVISKAIEEHGTPPHWFVKDSLEDIRKILEARIKKNLDRATTSIGKGGYLPLKPGEYELV